MRGVHRALRAIKGAEPCPCCGRTNAELNAAFGKKKKNPAPCKFDTAGSFGLCSSVRSQGDVPAGWSYAGTTSNPRVFGTCVVRDLRDATANRVREQWKAVEIAAERKELNTRQQARFQQKKTKIEATFDLYDAAAASGDAAEQQLLLERVQACERDIAAIRTKGLTTAVSGMAELSNPAIEQSVRKRLIDPEGLRFEALRRAAIKQPQAGAFPALAGSPHCDAEGRLLVHQGDAVVLAADMHGRITGLQTITDPRRNGPGKYAYPEAGPSFQEINGTAVNHLAIDTARGLDRASLFTSSPLIPLLEQSTGASVFAVDGAAKAWFTSAMTGHLTLGSVGAMHDRTINQIRCALDELEAQLGKQPTLYICLDAADVTNPSGMVGRLAWIYRELCAAGYSVFFLWWGQRRKSDGDIDELLHREHLLGSHHSSSFSKLTSREVLALQPDEARLVSERIMQGKRRSGAQLIPAAEAAMLPIETPFDDNPATDFFIADASKAEIVRAINEAIAAGYSAALLHLETGAGKTYAMVDIQPEEIDGCSRVVITSPLALTVAHEYARTQPDIVAVRGKDCGRTQLEDGRIVRSADPMDANQVLRPNCSKGLTIDYMRSANADGVAREICAKCSDRPRCMTTPGWYLADRGDAKAARRIIADPGSLQTENDIWNREGTAFSSRRRDRPGTVVACDESATVRWSQTVRVDWNEMAATYRQVEPFLQQSEKSLFQELLRMPKPKNYDAIVAGDLRVKLVGSRLPRHLQFKRAIAFELECVKSQDRQRQLRKLWLPLLVRFLSGKGDEYVAMDASGLSFTAKNAGITSAFKSGGIQMLVCADATGSRRELELRLGRRVAIIRQKAKPLPKGHRAIQVVGLGVGTGYGRSAITRWLMRMARQALPAYLGIPDDLAQRAIGYVDIKRALQAEYEPQQRTTAFRAGSRGINTLSDVSALVLNGTPRKNLLSQCAEWAVLTGEHLHPGDSIDVCRYMPSSLSAENGTWISFEQAHQNVAFRQWSAEELQAEFVQAKGRGRFNRRSDDEQTWIVSITDAALPWENTIVHINDLLGEEVVAAMRSIGDDRVIRSAWAGLPQARKTGLCLADALNVDPALLADRASFEDSRDEPWARAALAAAARSASRNYARTAGLGNPDRQTASTTARVEGSTVNAFITATKT
jgi:hypothetical protein